MINIVLEHAKLILFQWNKFKKWYKTDLCISGEWVDLHIYFFQEYAGELRIFALKRLDMRIYEEI